MASWLYQVNVHVFSIVFLGVVLNYSAREDGNVSKKKIIPLYVPIMKSWGTRQHTPIQTKLETNPT